MSTRKIVRLTAVDKDWNELGSVDGEELRVKVADVEGDLLIDNGHRHFFGEESGYDLMDLAEGRADKVYRLVIDVIELEE